VGVVRSALIAGAAGLFVVCAAGYRHGDLRVLDEREVTAELRAKAVDVLEKYSAEPLGTEVPIESGGHHYVARLEQHWDAQRGPHRGVTLYTSVTK